MARELTVWLFGERVGSLRLSNGLLNFRYDPEWLSRADSVPLSGSLPLQPEPFGDCQARPFFAGLLPEGELRRLLAQQLQVSSQNDFALLDQIGGECAGAVSLLQPGQLMSSHGYNVQWLSDDELVAILDKLPHKPMLAGQDDLRLSLAGAQDKLPVAFDGERIGLPMNGTPSSHILKPTIHGLAGTVVNEGFCLALADAMQLKVAKSQIRSVLGREFLLVERYDRVISAEGQWHRQHQEDFCQALGVIPEMKYQNEGGPDLAQCFDLVRRMTRPSAPHVLCMLDYVIFNALIGNHDAHAKNFSLLYTDKSAILAPLYDVLSTAIYPNLTPKMAMKIGGKYKFSEVQARHWDRFLKEAGLSRAQARKRIMALAKALPVTARELQSDPSQGFTGQAVVDQIVTLIEKRSALTLQRLGATSAEVVKNPSSGT